MTNLDMGKDCSFGTLKSSIWKGKRQPVIGIIEMTCKCSLRCKHCYAVVEDQVDEMTTEQLIKLAQIFKEKGILIITMTGG